MIEPVAGASFDCLLSNSPFVISPETSLIYRDGGASAARDSGGGLLRGDEFCRDAAAACSRLLAPSGLLVMQMNWSHAPGSSWMERLASWAPSSMQRWVLSTDTQAVDEYASMWIRHTMAGTPSWSPSQFERTFAAWMQYYQRLCIEQISYGAYVVRNAAPPCFAADDIDSRWIESGAIDCRSALDARAFAASLGDPSAIRDLRLKPAPALRMHQSLHPSGAEQPSTDTASLTHGPTGRILCTATRAVANLIMRLTGRTTLARAIDESATTLGLSGAEKSAFAESVHAAAFTLLREGGLLPQ